MKSKRKVQPKQLMSHTMPMGQMVPPMGGGQDATTRKFMGKHKKMAVDKPDGDEMPMMGMR